MLFNQTVIYALRAMHQLSLEYGEGYVRSSLLAEKTSVPSHYLLKIMKQVANSGLVDTQKGHHGGFRLARKPEEITVDEVLLALGVPLHSTSCAFGWERCDPEQPCPLHHMWCELLLGVRSWASETTLSILEPPFDRTPHRDE